MSLPTSSEAERPRFGLRSCSYRGPSLAGDASTVAVSGYLRRGAASPSKMSSDGEPRDTVGKCLPGVMTTVGVRAFSMGADLYVKSGPSACCTLTNILSSGGSCRNIHVHGVRMIPTKSGGDAKTSDKLSILCWGEDTVALVGITVQIVDQETQLLQKSPTKRITFGGEWVLAATCVQQDYRMEEAASADNDSSREQLACGGEVFLEAFLARGIVRRVPLSARGSITGCRPKAGLVTRERLSKAVSYCADVSSKMLVCGGPFGRVVVFHRNPSGSSSTLNYHTNRGSETSVGSHPHAAVLCVKIVGDSTILSGSDDRTVRVWKKDAKKSNPEQSPWTLAGTLIGHGGKVTCVRTITARADDLVFASASEDQTVRLWKHFRCVQVFNHTAPLRWCCLAFVEARSQRDSFDGEEEACRADVEILGSPSRSSPAILCGGDSGVYCFADVDRRVLASSRSDPDGADHEDGDDLLAKKKRRCIRDDTSDRASANIATKMMANMSMTSSTSTSSTSSTPNAVRKLLIDEPETDWVRDIVKSGDSYLVVSNFGRVYELQAKSGNCKQKWTLDLSTMTERTGEREHHSSCSQVQFTTAVAIRQERTSTLEPAQVFAVGTACGRVCVGYRSGIESLSAELPQLSLKMTMAERPFPDGRRVVKMWNLGSRLLVTTANEVVCYQIGFRSSSVEDDGEQQTEGGARPPDEQKVLDFSLEWTLPQLKIRSCALLRKYNAVVFGDDQGRLRVFALQSGKLLAEHAKAHAGKILEILNLGEDDDTFVTTGADSSVSQWRCCAGQDFLHAEDPDRSSARTTCETKNLQVPTTTIFLQCQFSYKCPQISQIQFYGEEKALLGGFNAGDFVLVAEFGTEEVARISCGGAKRAFSICSNEFAFSRKSLVEIHTLPRAGDTCQKVLDATAGKEILALAAPPGGNEEDVVFFSGGEENVLLAHTLIHSESSTGENEIAPRMKTTRVHRQASAVKALSWSSDGCIYAGTAHGELKVFETTSPFRLQSAVTVAANQRILAVATGDVVAGGGGSKNDTIWAATTSLGTVLVGTSASSSSTARRTSSFDSIPLCGTGIGVSLLVIPMRSSSSVVAQALVGATDGYIYMFDVLAFEQTSSTAEQSHSRIFFRYRIPLPGSVSALCRVDVLGHNEKRGPLVAACCDDGFCYVIYLSASGSFSTSENSIDSSFTSTNTTTSSMKSWNIVAKTAMPSVATLKGVRFCTRRQVLITAGWDRCVRLWDMGVLSIERCDLDFDAPMQLPCLSCVQTGVTELQSLCFDGASTVVVAGRGTEVLNVV